MKEKLIWLIVDDDPRLIQKGVLERVSSLMEEGRVSLVFVPCRSADEAIEAVRRHRPAILFLDHSFDDEKESGDGFDVLSVLQDEGVDTRIISITSNREIGGMYEDKGIEWVHKAELAQFIIDTLPT